MVWVETETEKNLRLLETLKEDPDQIKIRSGHPGDICITCSYLRVPPHYWFAPELPAYLPKSKIGKIDSLMGATELDTVQLFLLFRIGSHLGDRVIRWGTKLTPSCILIKPVFNILS